MMRIARTMGAMACGVALACKPKPRSPQQEGSSQAASSEALSVDADEQAAGGYLERVVQLDINGGKSCALTEDGSVYCWGHQSGTPGSEPKSLYEDAPRPYLVPAGRPVIRLFKNDLGLRALDVDGVVHASGSVPDCRNGPEGVEGSEDQRRRWLEAFPDEVVAYDRSGVVSSRLLPRPATVPVGASPLDVERVGICQVSDDGVLVCIDACGADALGGVLLKRPHVEPGILLDRRAAMLSAIGSTLYGPLPECVGEPLQRGECDVQPTYEASLPSDIREIIIRNEGTIAVLDVSGSVSIILVSPEHGTDPLPVYESFGSGISTIAMNGFNRVCGVQPGGLVFCQVPGPENPLWDKVQTISGTADIVQLSGGGTHMCGIRSDGRVACWGYNENGELGNGEPSGPGIDQKHATLVVAPVGGQSNGPQVAHRMEHTFRVPPTTDGPGGG
ncbi:MAG: hypothetical protein ACRBN8_45525 [Nannocystales bacterium]